MSDPLEMIAPDGTTRTGVSRDLVPQEFEAVTEAVAVDGQRSSLYLYGSVANGTARRPTSDVDFLSIDLGSASDLAAHLSRTFSHLCRGVEIASARAEDYRSETDEAYGNPAFLRRYWSAIEPERAAGAEPPNDSMVKAMLAPAGSVGQLVGDFRRIVGLWDSEP